MKKSFIFNVLLIFILSVTLNVFATESVKVKGKVYIDYYYIGAIATNSQAQSARLGEFSHLGTTTNAVSANGFQLRRIYLTLDKKLADNIKARVRFETGHTTYSINPDKSLIPFIKDAWIKWNYIDNHTVSLGIQGPGALGLYEEKLWKMRSVEKVPEDYEKIVSSRDFGIKLSGRISKLEYSLMLGNGHGSETEDSSTYKNAKKIFGALTYHIKDNLVAQLYGDTMVLPAKDMYQKEQYTGHLFLGYISDFMRLGLQYIYQDSALKNQQINIFSVPFGVNLSYKFGAFARIDYTQMNKFNNLTGKLFNTFIILGADYQIIKNLYLQPNIEMAMYSQEKNVPQNGISDVVARLTIYFKY